ncbi:hypothetical protein [Nonomuraea sp. LPB2021202275-12-8]|uniref:hypothetical protein n=1 Tax=Nonomuraea sp. LPB2021202275-12-8 TaxID=3120159 RepID=UPI00300CF0C3
MTHTFAAFLMVASIGVGGLAPTAQASATAAVAAPNLKACYDGNCKITLKKRASFRVSPRFGITRVTITFDSRSVRVRGTGPGVTSEGVFSKGGSASINGIGFQLVSLSGGKAVLRLKPVR